MDVMSLLGLGGKPGQSTYLPRVTAGQKNVQDQVLNSASGQLNSGQFDFTPIEQQARKNFSQSTIPSITNMFNTSGGEGLRSSSFSGAIGRAGSDLETNLAGMKSDYNLKQQGLIQQLLQMGMQPQFDTYHEPEGEVSGIFGNIMGLIGKDFASGGKGTTAIAGLLGGPHGAMIASTLIGLMMSNQKNTNNDRGIQWPS